MSNTFCHMELHSANTAGSKDFYGKLFGWGMQAMPMGDQVYTMFKTSDSDDDVHGGITQSQCPDGTSSWIAYVLVEDVAAALKKATDLGAEVLVPKTEIPGMGWMGVINDPAGARLGIWQSANRS
ncbi:MAG: VOC family protein [bacterium]|nr:VOC family protein [bacterium]